MVPTLSGSILSDPAWVGVIVGLIAMVVGAAVAIGIARWQRGPTPITDLSYRLSSSKLISTPSVGRLRLVLDDQELRQGGLVTLAVRNTGNQPIPRDAFDGPLDLVFSRHVRLLRASVVSVRPGTLRPQVRIAVAEAPKMSKGAALPPPPRLEIEPLSLNPGATFTCEMLVDGQDARPRLVGNILGVSDLHEMPDESRGARVDGRRRTGARRTEWTSVVVAMIGALAAVVSAFAVDRSNSDTVIMLTGKRQLCATEYRLTDRSVAVVEAGSGRLRDVPRGEVVAIRRDAC